MGTSVEMIDRTYGHSTPDAEDYERDLLDAYEARSAAFGQLSAAKAESRNEPEAGNPCSDREADARTRTGDPFITSEGRPGLIRLLSALPLSFSLATQRKESDAGPPVLDAALDTHVRKRIATDQFYIFGHPVDQGINYGDRLDWPEAGLDGRSGRPSTRRPVQNESERERTVLARWSFARKFQTMSSRRLRNASSSASARVQNATF
jgi:hypothetical protein